MLVIHPVVDFDDVNQGLGWSKVLLHVCAGE